MDPAGPCWSEQQQFLSEEPVHSGDKLYSARYYFPTLTAIFARVAVRWMFLHDKTQVHSLHCLPTDQLPSAGRGPWKRNLYLRGGLLSQHTSARPSWMLGLDLRLTSFHGRFIRLWCAVHWTPYIHTNLTLVSAVPLTRSIVWKPLLPTAVVLVCGPILLGIICYNRGPCFRAPPRQTFLTLPLVGNTKSISAIDLFMVDCTDAFRITRGVD